MTNIRAFVAVDVSNRLGIEKLQHELVADAGWTPEQIRPVKNQNLHFTLIFLGNIRLEIIDEIKIKMSEIQFEPIKITFTRIGGFPHPNYARVVWVGVDRNSNQQLVSLAEQVVIKLSQIGFAPEKPFTPHLTVFRVKGASLKLRTEILDKYGEKEFTSDIIDKVHLKRSDLTPSGPIYTNIFTVHSR
ncbi:MAG TPA: RNA 2',3'-cyclic phosphodiesterase [Candidatus Nitrosopolaris sp.]|nr:RNA 2',3'-cyclic phosphodiesterase [Candidatus Nitrosopolaris sp.]